MCGDVLDSLLGTVLMSSAAWSFLCLCCACARANELWVLVAVINILLFIIVLNFGSHLTVRVKYLLTTASTLFLFKVVWVVYCKLQTFEHSGKWGYLKRNVANFSISVFFYFFLIFYFFLFLLCFTYEFYDAYDMSPKQPYRPAKTGCLCFLVTAELLQIETNWCTNFLSVFIVFLYMFLSAMFPSKNNKHIKRICAPSWFCLQNIIQGCMVNET